VVWGSLEVLGKGMVLRICRCISAAFAANPALVRLLLLAADSLQMQQNRLPAEPALAC
jgi:hypothetical protein